MNNVLPERAMRYPMEGSEEPDIETAREAIELAEQVVALVRTVS